MTDLEQMPDWVSPPGDSILDILEERGWTQTELAERTGFSKKHINQLVKGKAPINDDTALKLERVLGSSAGFWLNREAQYRELLARRTELDDLKPYTPWLKELPIKEMVQFRWIAPQSNKVREVAACLRYFGVANQKAWESKYENLVLAYRASEKLEKKQGAVTAWLRYGEIQAESKTCPPFSKSALEMNLPIIKSLTREDDPTNFLPKLEELCAQAGIALVIAPAPTGCPVSGVTRWLNSEKVLIQLSLRYKSNDHFWFTLFHEIAHVLLHGKKMLFLELIGESLEDQAETEANHWAGNFLIPKAMEKKLRSLPLTPEAIKDFAQICGIAPGIIVGRLQKEGLLAWNTTLNFMKLKYEWAGDE